MVFFGEDAHHIRLARKEIHTAWCIYHLFTLIILEDIARKLIVLKLNHVPTYVA